MKRGADAKKIARERIIRLFELADAAISKERQDLANRYVRIARNISSRIRVRIPTPLKRRFCKHCGNYYVFKTNCRVRTREGIVVYTCMKCKKFTKYKYS